MPEPADKKCYHQVYSGSPTAAAASSQREIQIVAEPARETDMPSSPEFPAIHCKIGLSEIIHQADAKHLRRPDGNMAVTAEITVDLYRKQHRGKHEHAGGIIPVILIDLIDQNRSTVRNPHFFKIPPQHQKQSVLYPVIVELCRLLQLCKQTAAPLDRSRNKLREK